LLVAPRIGVYDEGTLLLSDAIIGALGAAFPNYGIKAVHLTEIPQPRLEADL